MVFNCVYWASIVYYWDIFVDSLRKFKSLLRKMVRLCSFLPATVDFTNHIPFGNLTVGFIGKFVYFFVLGQLDV